MSASFMNWSKICLKYQIYESFYSCFGARKIICCSEFPDILKNWWRKRKSKGNKETNKKKKNKKRKKKYLNFYSINSVSGVYINKNLKI